MKNNPPVLVVTMRVADQRNHSVAAGDVLFKLFQQRAAMLLKILLHRDRATDRPQVAGEHIAALTELS